MNLALFLYIQQIYISHTHNYGDTKIKGITMKLPMQYIAKCN